MTRKLSLSLGGLLLLLTLGIFSSCSKENSRKLDPAEEKEASEISSEGMAEADIVFNGVFDDAMGVNDDVGMSGTGVFGRLMGGREDSASACFTVSFDHPAGQAFPLTATIDFGAGCTGADGHTRFGKLVITYTGRLIAPGNSASVQFVNFGIDSIALSGLYSITNTGNNNRRQFTIAIENGKLLKTSGNYTSINSRRVITQASGLLTPYYPFDDIFTIEGESNGQVKRGSTVVSWDANISKPLVKKFTCRWIVEGVLNVGRTGTSNNSDFRASLDYGNGDCDRKATITINGQTREISLH